MTATPDTLLAPAHNATLLFTRSDTPETSSLVEKLRPALAYSSFDAAARPVDQEYDADDHMRISLRSLDSLKTFLNGSFNPDAHREAVSAIFTQVGPAATSLATTLLIGCTNDEARSLLKDVLRRKFIEWAYRSSPTEISDAFRSSGGWGLPVQNELAVLADEIRHNSTTGCTDYTFCNLLFDSGLNHPTRTIRHLGTRDSQTETEHCSPARLYDALVALNASDPKHLEQAWSQWGARENQPDSRAVPWQMTRQRTVDLPSPEEGLQSIRVSGILTKIPSTLASANDLDDTVIDQVLAFAHVLEAARLRQWTARGPAPAPILQEFIGRRALSVFDQPSTRSSLAVRDAMRLLGIEVDEMIGGSSSRGKGESVASELYTFSANGIDALFERSSSAELAAALRMKVQGVSPPVQVNMGGNLHHPTQTFADLMTIMEHYGCQSYSLQELRDKTNANPPTIVFYGRFTQKRADQALADFASTRLGWKCVIVAPYEQDLPADSRLIEHRYVLADKHDQAGLLKIMQEHSAAILYMSNAEATADTSTKGTGQGRGEPATALTLDTLQRSGAFLMHPLPDSGELQTEIFGNRLFLGARQIVNKVYFTAAMTACMLAARGLERRE